MNDEIFGGNNKCKKIIMSFQLVSQVFFPLLVQTLWLCSKSEDDLGTVVLYPDSELLMEFQDVSDK